MNDKLNTSGSVIRYGIRLKLLLGFFVVLLLTLLVGGVGYYGVYKINLEAEDLGEHWLKATSSLAKVVANTEDTRRYLLAGFLMRADEKTFQDNKAQFAIIKVKWEQDFAEYNNYVTTTEGIAKSEAMRKSFDEYIDDAEQVWMLTQLGQDVEARPILTQKSKESFDQLLKDMEAQMEFMVQGGVEATHHAQTTENSVMRLLIIFVTLALIVGATLAIMIARHISRPLVSVTKVAQAVAAGDLNIKMPKIRNHDEIGVLTQAVSEMVDSLRDVIREVLTQSEGVAATSQELSAAAEEATAASEQISDSIAQLAAGATDQAMSVRNTGLVIEQLSESAQQVAVNAEVVNQSSGKAAKAAQVGALQAENAVRKIEQIRDVSLQTAETVFKLGDQSKKIGQIVDVIKGIADQTNLLALNAAIEAARAGENGRGFAVVAEEVRKLAEQSSLSATQIASLIGDIQQETERAVGLMDKGKEEVDSGVEAVNLAGVSFHTIVGEIDIVVDQIRLVTAAAQQMASGAAQTVKSVEGIGVIAEQSSASAEEISATSEEQAATMVSVSQSAEALAKLGESLKKAVDKFKV
ncbi:methyl-accepting chemotaxis protein [Desulfosporosinus sp. BICA1-9]|uniref:methyl-accepting chemotaxis protein n=1 Tax=Desulfosporosinus sp. BICA1-9 TaxID=1531958 RepID=UPI00054C4606|nr:HAMP domain-containing methyl-accepting chemotaxis protein [Desulfosporosinus sp. BICA1-9]KJS46417.1 MAG: signal protein [Peptococcaceae bacterium BRH_c23]KJS84063.1 MAG: signal protein [Desulfosporosinus sp. BICA1-9]HBW35114.1 methyl-accepting chemotaxis protein [Desulfosporosinus sp.]